MRRSAGCARAACRRSWPIGWRSGFELALALAIACSGGSAVTAQPVTFTDHGMTQQAGNDGGARIAASVDAARTGLRALAPAAPTGPPPIPPPPPPHPTPPHPPR